MNAYGEPLTIADIGGTISYDYNSLGLPTSITSNGSTITMEYDAHGNRTSIDDPDAGTIVTTYNAYDELVSQADARDNTYTMTYDLLGRITERAGDETTTWAYSATPGHLGELTSVSCDNNTSQAYDYDNLGRITSQTENIQGETFTQYYTYDGLGRLQTQSWNTGFGIRHLYNQNGYLREVQTGSEQTVWEAETYNVRGQITGYLLGDDYRTTRDWDSYGYPEEIRTKVIGQTPDILCHIYNFDALKGNLTQRRSTAGCYNVEDFTYDALNRLTDETISSNTLSTTYASNGNITNRSDVGDYNYVGSGAHAVTGLENTTGSLLPTSDQTVDYTSFNKASHISQGNLDYFITYGADRLRRKIRLNSGIGDDVLLTKYYVFGDYEKVTDADGTKHLHYISGGDGLAAIYVKYDYAPDSMYYIMKDHLGSMVGAINEETGTIFRQSFDAWGRNRNPDNWTYTNIPDFPFDRGYTGHEHLKWFGLINMNGRMYDVALARFLSPDIFIQNSASTQSFNRYSYCINNPLNAIDPSGYDKLAFRGDYGSTSFEDPYRKEPSKSNMERILWRQQNAPGPTFDQWVENNTVTFYGENGTAFLNDHFNGLTIYEVNAFGKTTLACSFGELGDVIFGTDGGISFTSPTDGAYLPGIGINDQAGGGGIRNGLDIAGKTSYVAGMANIGAVILEKEYVRQATYNAKIAGQTGKVIPNYLRAISRTGKVLGGVGVLTTYGIAGYDVLNGNANTSTWVDVGATTLLFGAAILGGPIVAGGAVVGGVIYGGARLFYGDNVDSWINNNWGYNNQ